jgi:hypothetical protein
MKELNFDTGVVAYRVNGGHVIRFNPADNRFVERLFTVFDRLSHLQEEGERSDALQEDGAALWASINARDAEMRQHIDSVFGEHTADGIFPDVGVYALADGLPLWMNFFLAVMDEVDSVLAEEQKKANPRVERYMKKYEKYQRK